MEYVGDHRLLITTIGYGISLVIVLLIFVFVLLKGERKPIHLTFLGFNFAAIVYAIMFMFGTNVTDSALSTKIWLFSAFNIPLALFFAHWVLILTEQEAKQRRILIGLYALGMTIFAAMFIFPDLVITSSSPKLYFNNYPNPGILYGGMVTFFVGVVGYAMAYLVKAYLGAKESMRNRFRYVLFGSIVGFSTGSSSLFLSWNIPFDPMFSMFFGLYNSIFAYAILKHQLMDIRFIIRKTLVYSVLVAVISWVIIMVGVVNEWLVAHIPGFSPWITPTVAAVAAVVIGKLYLNKSEEAEKIKYEFITVAAHKLRTPLTRSRYAAIALLDKLNAEGQPHASEVSLENNRKTMLEEIVADSSKVIKLANTLLKAAEVGEQHYAYSFESVNLKDIVERAVHTHQGAFKKKSIEVKTFLPTNLPPVRADVERLGTVIDILIENAIMYSPLDTAVTISLSKRDDNIQFSIEDQGIGIAKEDISHIFLKLYRTHAARHTDIEGVGVGLFISKSIVEQHGGKIWAKSEGEGKGSTFYFEVPIA